MDSHEPEPLGRWLRGDPGGFEPVYALEAPALASFCRMLTGNEGAAADLFQDTWSQALARLGTYRRERPLKAWLMAIAYHLWVDQERRRGVERRMLEERRRRIPDASPGRPGEELALLELLERLPDAEREIVLLYDLQGLTLRESAGVLSVSPSTVQARLARAHEALAGMLREAELPVQREARLRRPSREAP